LRKFSIQGGAIPGNNIFIGSHFIKRVTRVRAFQLSLIARALPPATKGVCDRTLRAFLEDACEPDYVSSWRPSNRFEALVKEITQLDRADDYCPGLPGQSSCFGSSRSEGGQASVFATELDPSLATKLIPTEKVTRASRHGGIFAIAKAKKDFAKKFTSEVNVMRVIPLAERGAKCRIVTCSNPHYVSEAHSERRRLWRLILTIPQISRHLGRPATSFRVQQKGWVVSTDMSKATDNISHETLSWFCLSFNLDPRLVYKGFLISTDDGTQDYRRGCPMGMPCSWAILSLIHYMIMRSCGIRDFAIRGDDALAVMAERQWDEYVGLVESSGMRINRQKTYVGPDFGTFCERLYEKVGNNMVLRPSLGLRMFNPENRAIVLKDLSSVAGESLLPLHTVHRSISLGARWLFDLARKFKVPKYLPSFYGGIGLPPPSRKWKSRRYETWKIRYAATHGLPLTNQLIIGGKYAKIVARSLAKIKVSLSTSHPCLHVERLVMDALLPAQISDIRSGYRTSRELTCTQYMEQMKRIWDAIPSARGGKLFSDYLYMDLYSHRPTASAESVSLALGHAIDRKDPSYCGTPFVASLEKSYKTFFTNF